MTIADDTRDRDAGPGGRDGQIACAAVKVLAVVVCAATAAWFGPDANWDLRNYHLYVAWAWLEDRHAQDLAAAQAQTWFNPLPWVPHFLAFRQFDGVALAALVGALQGLCALPLWALAARLLPSLSLPLRAALVAAGMTAATFIGQLGASYGDVMLAGLALCGVVLAADAARAERVDRGRALAAGIAFGAMAALKLAHAPVALGLCLALPVLASDRAARLRLLGWVAAGALFAFALLAGPWAWTLWRDWGNPVFPQFDTLFGGDWIAPGAARDLRFLPGSAAESLLRPLAPLLDWRATSDYRIRDARLPLLCVALIVLVLRWRALDVPLRRLAGYLGLAAAIAYALWLPLFGYHRYLVTLEMFAPLLLLAVSAPAAPRRMALGAVLLAVLATNPPNHERASRDWPAGRPVAVPAGAIDADTLLVLAGTEPTAHVLPFLPRFAGAVRIESNLLPAGVTEGRLRARISERIVAHSGRLVLLLQGDPATLAPVLTTFGLRRANAACSDLTNHLLPDGALPLRLCLLERAGP